MEGMKAMQVQPYLFFNGRTEEAIEFYKKALGAEVATLMRYKDGPEPSICPPGSENKVMHASFRIGDTSVIASDGRNTGKPVFQGFSLTIAAKSDARSREAVHRARGRRTGADAAYQDLLFLALWHGCRPLRRELDDHRGGFSHRVTTTAIRDSNHGLSPI